MLSRRTLSRRGKHLPCLFETRPELSIDICFAFIRQSDITATDGNTYTLTPDLLTIERKTIKHSSREYTPNVIEPSFGIGRILYSVLEHAFWSRADDADRRVLSLPPTVAPIKCLLVPLSGNEDFKPILREVSKKMRNLGLSCRVDDSGASIGRRYSRNDELGTPFGVTIDFACMYFRGASVG